MSARRVATDPRISRRRSTIARSKRRKLATGMITVVGLGAIAWAALASPLLAIDDVRVTGAKHTTADQIAQAAGLGPEDNLLLISTDAIARAAETLPWVRRAEVDRILPGIVRVRVTERVPALLLSIGAARWTLDARGNVLASGTVTKGLPTIAGVETVDVEVGQRVASPELIAALKAFRALTKQVRSRVAAVVAPSLERISFSLASGTLIRFGAAESLAAKREVISALLADLTREHRSVAYIDVRVPASPAIGPAATAPAGPAPSPTASPPPTRKKRDR